VLRTIVRCNSAFRQCSFRYQDAARHHNSVGDVDDSVIGNTLLVRSSR
jgi:hypothetical protein